MSGASQVGHPTEAASGDEWWLTGCEQDLQDPAHSTARIPRHTRADPVASGSTLTPADVRPWQAFSTATMAVASSRSTSQAPPKLCGTSTVSTAPPDTSQVCEVPWSNMSSVLRGLRWHLMHRGGRPIQGKAADLQDAAVVPSHPRCHSSSACLVTSCLCTSCPPPQCQTQRQV